MPMNAISTDLEFMRTLEERSQSDDRSPKKENEYIQFNEKCEELTRIEKAPTPQDQEHNPYFSIEKLEPFIQTPVKVYKLLKNYQDPEGRREYERFDIKMSVCVYTSTNSHRTESVNISAGGVQLAAELPDHFYGRSFDLVFIVEGSEREYFLVKGRLVSQTSVEFEGVTLSAMNILNRLIKRLNSLSR